MSGFSANQFKPRWRRCSTRGRNAMVTGMQLGQQMGHQAKLDGVRSHGNGTFPDCVFRQVLVIFVRNSSRDTCVIFWVNAVADGDADCFTSFQDWNDSVHVTLAEVHSIQM